jgi:2-dehydro-3-deoxygluconokinase
MLELSAEGNLTQAKSFQRNFGGDTLNTAVGAARLGSTVAYVTRIGDDPFASQLQDMIIQEGIVLESGRIRKGKTGLYIVSVDHQGNREFAYYRENSAASLLSPQDISPQLIQGAKIVYASGITLAISDSAQKAVYKAFKIAKEAGIVTALDPNYRESLWPNAGKMVDALNEILPLVDILMPSFPEDTGAIISFKKPEQALEHFMLKGVPLVVLKAGSEGCYMGYRSEVMHIPTTSTRAVDTTGAGDAFNAGFLHGLSRQESLMQCAKLGTVTASLKILNRGSASAMPNKESVYSRVFSAR